MERVFVCGTKAVVKAEGREEYHVVCATCGAGGLAPWPTKETAARVAVRDSNKGCAKCGAA